MPALRPCVRRTRAVALGQAFALALALGATALAAANPHDPFDPHGDRGPGMQGADLVAPTKAVVRALTPGDPGKPWQDDLAALTSSDPAVGAAAAQRVASYGAAVIPDLAVLSRDRDPLLRGRVCSVLGAIGAAGGEPAANLALQLSDDRDVNVRGLAVLALGRCPGTQGLPRLIALIGHRDPELRIAAAQALGGLGDPRAIPVLARHGSDPDDLAARARAAALRSIVATPAGVPALIETANALAPGQQRRDVLFALVDASRSVADPRLCPLLTTLTSDDDALIAVTACAALTTSGDARAVAKLIERTVQAAPAIAGAAAETLRVLTRHQAGPGQAWAVWWRDQQGRIARLAERDALLASLHDPNVTADPAALRQFTPDELMPLIDASLVPTLRTVAAWWPARAGAAWRADIADPSRRDAWIPALLARLAGVGDQNERAGLIVLLDHAAPRSQRRIFTDLMTSLDARREAQRTAAAAAGTPLPDLGAERAALRIAIERR